jgi:hypothetical protein
MGRFRKHDPKTYEAKKVAISGGAGVATGTTVSRIVGPLSKGAGVAGKVVSKVAQPLASVAAAYGAYKGAGEDDNTLRGAGRGVINALNPSTLTRSPGYGQEAYDRQFGKADPVKMQRSWGDRLDSARQAAKDWGAGLMDRFHQANQKYNPMHASGQDQQQPSGGPSGVVDGGRGWANPKVQKAAQEARKAKRGQ